jgi:biotin carboxylase
MADSLDNRAGYDNQAALVARPRRVVLLLTPQSYRAEDFLTAAGRLGIEVAPVIDMARPLADFWDYRFGVDFRDLEAATRAIVAFAADQPLAAVLAVDDAGALLAAQASAALGLPHNSPEAALAARDKHRMRRLLQQAGVQAPRFELFTTADEPESVAQRLDYPCVVKPLRLSGSRGVIRADDPAQFVAAFRRTARLVRSPDGAAQPLLVEQYVPGVEVALEGLLDQEQLRVLALFDKPDPLEGPFFEETIYVTPSRLPAAVQEAIAGCTAAAAAALGLRQGPVHAELRLNEAGPWLIEVAGRSIGGLCAHTLRFGEGVSLEELILRQACGLELGNVTREEQARGVMMIPIPAAGLLREVRGLDEARAVPGIEEVQITAKLNYELVPLPEGESYLGFIFARGDTAANAEAALRQAHARLHFVIEPVIRLEIG